MHMRDEQAMPVEYHNRNYLRCLLGGGGFGGGGEGGGGLGGGGEGGGGLGGGGPAITQQVYSC